MKKLIGIIFTCLFVSAQSYAFDKEWVAYHLRAMLGLDMRQQIVVGDPSPSEIPGLLTIAVTIGGGSYPIYMTLDESKYLWGSLNDLTIDPDKARQDKLNLFSGHSKGSKTAPVTLVEFTDLQCPYCSIAHQGLIKNLYTKYTKEQVRWVFKHFPLSNHQWAEPAAVAAECASMQSEDAFWKMTDQFYVAQSSITKDTVNAKSVEFAQTMKLNVEKFKACLASPEAAQRVRFNREEGAKLGVSSTPTIFINGRLRRGFNTFEDLQVVIDEKLNQATQKK